MSTHVCLVSRQPLPNLLGVLELRPTHVVLLTTDAEDAVRLRLETWLAQSGVSCQIHRVDPYDPRSVRAACRYYLDHPPSEPVLLNATGGTKIAALAAVAELQARPSAESFYVNTDAQCIQWILPPERPPEPLKARVRLVDYLAVHGFTVAREETGEDALERGGLSMTLARLAARAEPLMGYFRTVFYLVDKERLSIAEALERTADDFPPDPGPAQRAILDELASRGMVVVGEDAVTSVRSKDDLHYLGGGRWLEEYVYLALRDLGLDAAKMNVVLRWGERGTAKDLENEIDVLVLHRARLYLFSCKTGRAVASERKDEIGQEEVFKLEALREVAGGVYARAVLVAGSRLTNRIKARCGRLGIGYVDANDLHRFGEHARRILGV